MPARSGAASVRPALAGSEPSLTPDGKDLIDLLHLDAAPALQVRRRYLRILKLKERYHDDTEVDKLFLDAFGFPEDLPDLVSMRPPGGNSRGGGRHKCFRALRNTDSGKELPV
jgi:hypothetical protein